MKQFLRPILRVAVLAALIFAVVTLVQPAPAAAFTCFSDCYAAYQSCLAECRSLPHQPSEGCTEFCQPGFQDCLSGC
jgi:hypothetical protein